MHFLLALYQFSGAGNAVQDIWQVSAAAQARGHQVALLTGRPPEPGELPPGVELLPFRAEGWCEWLRRKRYVQAFTEAIRDGGYDASLAMEPLPGASFHIARRLLRLDGDPGLHGLTIWNPLYRQRCAWEKALYLAPSAAGIFYVAEPQKLALQLTYGLPASRLIALPPGLDPECRIPGNPHEFDHRRLTMRSRLGLTTKDILVIQAASEWPRQGVDRSLVALAAMPHIWQNRVHFFVVGTGGSQKKLEHWARAAHFPETQVVYRSEGREFSDLLLSSDLMLHPAREESEGTVLADAIACGVPVICTAACGYSPFVQAAGCPVIPTPFHRETLEDALAFTLPELNPLKAVMLVAAAKQDFASRAACIVEHLEHAPALPDFSSLFPPEKLRQILFVHQQLKAARQAIKDDAKRAVTRVALPDGTECIVKEFKRRPWWHWIDNARRTVNGTALLRTFSPYCWGQFHDEASGSTFLVFRDCGPGNFYQAEYAARADASTLYAACGELLAQLHTAGLYHEDTKPANFIVNLNCLDECPRPVCIIDCDNIRQYYPPVPMKLRLHNVAQFIAGTGKIANDNEHWRTLVEAFRIGYSRHALLSHADLDQFWQRAWRLVHQGKHIESNLPFRIG